MKDISYSAHAITVDNPFRPYGIARIALGVVIAALAGGRVLSSLASVQRIGGSEPDVIAVLGIVAVVVALGWFLWALKSLLLGMRSMGRLAVPPSTPPDLKNEEEIEQAFIRRTLLSQSMPEGGPLHFAYRYVSDRVPFLTNKMRTIVEDNIRFSKNVLLVTLLLIVVFAFQQPLSEALSQELGLYPPLEIGFPVLLVGLLMVVAVVKIGSLFFMMPSMIPQVETLESIESVHGGGDPFHLPSLLQKKLTALRFGDIPNRVTVKGFDKHADAAVETGSFAGRMFLETQPEAVPHDRDTSIVFVYLLVAALLIVVSVVLMTGIPSGELPALGYAGALIQGWILAVVGLRLLRHTHYLLGTFRFESLGLLFQAEGTFGRTQARAGKGITDSFETSNTVVRSDSNIRFYCGQILSESYQLDGEREIIDLSIDARSSKMLDYVREVLDEFETRGIVIRGIDVDAPGMQSIAGSNIKYAATKKRVEAGEQLPEHLSDALGGTDPPRELEEPQSADGDSEQTPEEKECPDCAEMVKYRARKCRFCGYVFSEAE